MKEIKKKLFASHHFSGWSRRTCARHSTTVSTCIQPRFSVRSTLRRSFFVFLPGKAGKSKNNNTARSKSNKGKLEQRTFEMKNDDGRWWCDSRTLAGRCPLIAEWKFSAFGRARVILICEKLLRPSSPPYTRRWWFVFPYFPVIICLLLRWLRQLSLERQKKKMIDDPHSISPLPHSQGTDFRAYFDPGNKNSFVNIRDSECLVPPPPLNPPHPIPSCFTYCVKRLVNDGKF